MCFTAGVLYLPSGSLVYVPVEKFISVEVTGIPHTVLLWDSKDRVSFTVAILHLQSDAGKITARKLNFSINFSKVTGLQHATLQKIKLMKRQLKRFCHRYRVVIL